MRKHTRSKKYILCFLGIFTITTLCVYPQTTEKPAMGEIAPLILPANNVEVIDTQGRSITVTVLKKNEAGITIRNGEGKEIAIGWNKLNATTIEKIQGKKAQTTQVAPEVTPVVAPANAVRPADLDPSYKLIAENVKLINRGRVIDTAIYYSEEYGLSLRDPAGEAAKIPDIEPNIRVLKALPIPPRSKPHDPKTGIEVPSYNVEISIRGGQNIPPKKEITHILGKEYFPKINYGRVITTGDYGVGNIDRYSEESLKMIFGETILEKPLGIPSNIGLALSAEEIQKRYIANEHDRELELILKKNLLYENNMSNIIKDYQKAPKAELKKNYPDPVELIKNLKIKPTNEEEKVSLRPRFEELGVKPNDNVGTNYGLYGTQHLLQYAVLASGGKPPSIQELENAYLADGGSAFSNGSYSNIRLIGAIHKSYGKQPIVKLFTVTNSAIKTEMAKHELRNGNACAGTTSMGTDAYGLVTIVGFQTKDGVTTWEYLSSTPTLENGGYRTTAPKQAVSFEYSIRFE